MEDVSVVASWTVGNNNYENTVITSGIEIDIYLSSPRALDNHELYNSSLISGSAGHAFELLPKSMSISLALSLQTTGYQPTLTALL